MADQKIEDIRSWRALWLRLMFFALMLLPLVALFILPTRMLAGIFWFWFLLLICFWVAWLLMARFTQKSAAREPEIHLLADEPQVVRDVMDVQLAEEQSGISIFRGRLREPAEEAFLKLKQTFGNQSVPLIQEDPRYGAAIVMMPKPIEQAVMERRSHPWVNWLLLFTTLITTTFAGAAHQGVDLFSQPQLFSVGLPYALGLMAILGVHELGHFFAARHHGMDVTPPYFIPVPFALGTFGAFIKMRSPAEERTSLFDVAVAGPLAGLAIAIPALLIGLHSSVVIPTPSGVPQGPLNDSSVGSSILFALLAKVSLGPALLRGSGLRLSPLAFAGWLGLVITALNLLPIGQLDGGHTARAMFGTRIGRAISNIAMWSLFIMAVFFWPGLLFWAIIVFFLAGNSSPPLNDVTPISKGRIWLGYFTFVILALILIPLPPSWWNAMGIYSPYV